ncbi:CsbD family protein [Weissella kandleri]|uniref:CsbD family protein n=1 Tax=Weissella kandleri TaxID=1616 RepID=UPI00387EE434
MALDDKLDGMKDQALGKAKEVSGKVTGDKQTEAEGKAEGVMGKAKEKFGDVKDAAADMVDDVKEKLKE